VNGLDATVGVRLGALLLDVVLRVEPGATVAVLGPNGAGKSTLLRALAGLVPLERGRVVLDGATLDDPARRTYLPPERRPIGFVFQDHVLFPHLDALENVAFGLRARGATARAARRTAAEWLARVGLDDRARARPHELSGGQAQRVALARALATEPRLLLLDEPLASLDASTRPDVRRALRRHLAAHPGVRVLVTHDPLEAIALADLLVVLEDGRVVQTGAPAAITARPRSRYVADLAGVNLLRGRATAGAVVLDAGARLAVAEDTEGDVLAVVHPRAVSLHADAPHGSPRNVWRVTVAAIDPEGSRVRVELAGEVPLVAEITAAAAHELALRPGATVWCAVKASEVTVYPA
jgi:molybdate transport system ATP-binding protein